MMGEHLDRSTEARERVKKKIAFLKLNAGPIGILAANPNSPIMRSLAFIVRAARRQCVSAYRHLFLIDHDDIPFTHDGSDFILSDTNEVLFRLVMAEELEGLL